LDSLQIIFSSHYYIRRGWKIFLKDIFTRQLYIFSGLCSLEMGFFSIFFFLNYHHPGEICKLFWFIKIFSIGWRNLNNHLSILYVDLVFQFFNFSSFSKMIFERPWLLHFLFWKNNKFLPGKNEFVVGFKGHCYFLWLKRLQHSRVLSQSTQF